MSEPGLDRRDVVRRLLRHRGNGLVVAGLGNSAWDVTAAGDTPTNFYLWGAMGGATMLGLGLALAQPARRVVTVTGDGEMLMGVGSLATVACERPTNLAVVVLDNGRFGETGMQASHTARGTDLVAIALAAGFAEAVTIRSAVELDGLAERLFHGGLLFAAVKVSAASAPPSLPPRDGPFLRSRFREAVLGSDTDD